LVAIRLKRNLKSA